MKTFLLSLAVFSTVVVAPAFAGGDPDQLGANLYGADSNAGQGVSVGAESTSTVMTTDKESSEDQMAAAARPATLWQIALVVAMVAVAGGLLYWSYKRNKISS